MKPWKSCTGGANRVSSLFAVVLVLNLISMVAVPNAAVAQERPALTYFALGDSYASGHGLLDEVGTGKDGAGKVGNCRRAPSSYPYLVARALGETYTVDLHHLACSGATAGPTTLKSSDKQFHPDKDLGHQVETAEAFLNERDQTGNTAPVLITITIGANDLGIDGAEAEAIRQVFQPVSSNLTGAEFFEWLDGKTASIDANLTPGIDRLLDHENVYVVLTDYPNPFRENGFAGACTNVFDSLTCDDRMEHLMLSLTATMAKQVGRVDDRSHLHIATLGSRFASHYSDCGPFSATDNANETWFQNQIQVSDYTRVIDNAEWNILLNDLIANMDQCFHPNALGAQAIADAVVERVRTMLPAPVTAQPTPAPSESGTANTPDPSSGVPTFHLPWESESVWQITVGNGQGEHADAANYHGFDAVPVPGRGTDKVVAVADGIVMDFQESMPDSEIVNGGHAGNCVIIDHGGSVFSIYAHLARDSVPLSKGQQITSGAVIGTMGNSGFSTGPHLHWAVLNSARMYTDPNVSPYQTCAGRTMESRYADNDAELIEDGGVPRTGRLYASTNVGSGTVQVPPAPTEVPPTEAATQATDPPASTQVPPTEAAALDSDTAPMDIGAHGPNGHEIGAQFTVTTEDGEALGSCTLEGNVDDPLPVTCKVDVPRGITVVVTLDESTISDGRAPVENPISFDTSTDPGAASHWGVSFQIESEGATTGQTADIAIVTTEKGQPAYDACYVLVNFSEEGCDENRNGEITFQDIPLDTYTLRQTADLGPGRSAPDTTITVSGAIDADGYERFSATIVASDGSSTDAIEPTGQAEAVDIALITREPENGDLLTGACYVLVDYSIEGCDENGDGQVTFADIPFGTYTVRQTQTPAGYSTINDYDITVAGTGYMEAPSIGVPLGFIVRQAPEQNAPDTRNVSVVFLDMVTHERVTTGACVELIGASNVGCDEDLIDG